MLRACDNRNFLCTEHSDVREPIALHQTIQRKNGEKQIYNKKRSAYNAFIEIISFMSLRQLFNSVKEVEGPFWLHVHDRWEKFSKRRKSEVQFIQKIGQKRFGVYAIVSLSQQFSKTQIPWHLNKYIMVKVHEKKQDLPLCAVRLHSTSALKEDNTPAFFL